MSYYTKYFKNDDLSSIKSGVNTCVSKLNDAITKSADLSSLVSSSDLMCDSKSVFSEAIEKNNSRISELKNKLDKFVSIIDSASDVKSTQTAMESLEDYDTLVTKASSIESEIDSIIDAIESL